MKYLTLLLLNYYLKRYKTELLLQESFLKRLKNMLSNGTTTLNNQELLVKSTRFKVISIQNTIGVIKSTKDA